MERAWEPPRVFVSRFRKNGGVGDAPFFDGQGESFANYARADELWSQAERASAPILDMATVLRDVCVAAGCGRIMGRDGVVEIMELIDSLAPDAADSVRQEVARSLRFERAGQTKGGY